MCSSCTLSISNSKMDGSSALSGGAIMVENSASGTIQSTSFIGTKALYYGGVMSLSLAGLSTPVATTITFKDCPDLRDNSALSGGVFYLNQPMITVVLDNVEITNPTAAEGGVAKIDLGMGLTIKNSNIKDVNAVFASVLFSQSIKFNLEIS